MEMDWVIVGGGIHGVHLAARLIGEAQIPSERLRIVDPASRLLARWRECTEATGMTHLRSPSVHHLDLHPWSLQRFAGKRKKREPRLFSAPYDRPALHLFNAHCDWVLDIFGLEKLHMRGRVVECRIDNNSVTVCTDVVGELATQNVILAIGANERPLWPSWASKEHARIHHIFDPHLEDLPLGHEERIAVVGGGISASQVALCLSKKGHQVHLLSRHALRKHQFDSDPGWLGPRFMAKFAGERNHDRRRAIIREARHRGSVPPDIYRALRWAIERGEIQWYEAEIEEFETREERVRLNSGSAEVPEVDHVLLATGFASERPGGAMIDKLLESASLPCASCGYPIVDTKLRWHPNVFVTGPLAELELGPTSRNISGARHAADRVIKALQK